MSGEWTPADIDGLRALWGQGLTAAAIAAKLGKSRNAVLGKAHRLGLDARPNPIKQAKRGPKPRPEPRDPVVKVVRRAPLPKSQAPQCEGVTGVGGRHGVCQYVVGDAAGAATRYCGAEAQGSYCVGHRPFVYAGRAVA
jgi:hypothetical protein